MRVNLSLLLGKAQVYLQVGRFKALPESVSTTVLSKGERTSGTCIDLSQRTVGKEIIKLTHSPLQILRELQ